jgi:PTS system mannose-specific IIC component
MPAADYLISGAVAVGAGLDRTAALQIMISRPIVAAPLTGWLLGEPLVGLQVGALLELLWLGRLPVGAAIPPDDTQVAVASTLLTVTMGEALTLSGLPLLLLCTLVAMPLGKIGQLAERLARNWNGRLLIAAETALEAGDLAAAERSHLWGLAHFALASLASFAVIVLAGTLMLHALAPLLAGPVEAAAGGLRLTFLLVGIAIILGSLNVKHARTLFGASFATVLLLLWLL